MGSACLFFALGPERAILGDLNRELVSTYRVLREHPGRSPIGARMGVRLRTYYRVRGQESATLGELDAAARFIYLNRLCFNGVFRTNRLGQFNVPYGRRPGAVPGRERFAACAQLLQRAELRAGDFESTVRRRRQWGLRVPGPALLPSALGRATASTATGRSTAPTSTDCSCVSLISTSAEPMSCCLTPDTRGLPSSASDGA